MFSRSCCCALVEPQGWTPVSPFARLSACLSLGLLRGWPSPGCRSPSPPGYWSATWPSNASQHDEQRSPRGQCSSLQQRQRDYSGVSQYFCHITAVGKCVDLHYKLGFVSTHQQRQRPACAACDTPRWFQKRDPPGRSTPPPAGSRWSPALLRHRAPSAAAHGYRRQTCRGSGRQTWSEDSVDSDLTNGTKQQNRAAQYWNSPKWLND